MTEYYRRPGWRAIRIVLGPLLVALGIGSLRGAEDPFNRVMGGVMVLFGAYYALKPFLAAWVLTRERRRHGHADREVAVTLDRRGIEIEQGDIRTRLAWDDVVAAGRAKGYVWYELAGGTRATIPDRAIEDAAALEARLRAHTEWVG